MAAKSKKAAEVTETQKADGGVVVNVNLDAQALGEAIAQGVAQALDGATPALATPEPEFQEDFQIVTTPQISTTQLAEAQFGRYRQMYSQQGYRLIHFETISATPQGYQFLLVFVRTFAPPVPEEAEAS